MNCVFFLLLIAALAFTICAATHEIRKRIFNGQNVEPGQFQFMALVIPEEVHCCGLIKDTNICAGAIIAANWVLTAAHCLDGKFRADVYLGAITAGDVSTSYKVTKNHFVIHPYWDNESLNNDIALIRIPTTKQCDKIAYAWLPSRWEGYPGDIFANKIATIMGWGETSNDGDFPNHLQKAKVKVMSKAECQLNLPYITEMDICVATHKPFGSICMGDSGGPLVLEESDELIGVASFLSSESCEDGDVNVFMRVTNYLPWIKKIIED